MVHEATGLDLSGCKRLQQRPKENCVRPPFGEYWYTKEVSMETSLPSSSWERLEAQSCGDGHEAADAFTQSLFLIQGKAHSGQGRHRRQEGLSNQNHDHGDLGSDIRTFFNLLSQEGCHSMGFHRGAVQARKQSHPLLSYLLLQGDGIS